MGSSLVLCGKAMCDDFDGIDVGRPRCVPALPDEAPRDRDYTVADAQAADPRPLSVETGSSGSG